MEPGVIDDVTAGDVGIVANIGRCLHHVNALLVQEYRNRLFDLFKYRRHRERIMLFRGFCFHARASNLYFSIEIKCTILKYITLV